MIGLLRAILIAMEKTQSRDIFKIAAMIILLAYFPAFIAWTVLGTMWFSDIHKNSPRCIDENSSWIAVFWISISYFLIFVYFATLLTICIELVSYIL
jgi:hypothetical protein